MRDLAKGLPEESFWATFVQCLLCKDVIFRETFAANHTCDIDEPQARRYHPYAPAATMASSSRSTRARVSATRRLQRTYAFRISPSPVPTEPATEVEGNIEAGDNTEVGEGGAEGWQVYEESNSGEADDEEFPIFGDGDDLPSVPQIIAAQDLERQAAGGN